MSHCTAHLHAKGKGKGGGKYSAFGKFLHVGTVPIVKWIMPLKIILKETKRLILTLYQGIFPL